MTAEVIDFVDAQVRANDHIVRGTAAGGMIRALAITARDSVQAVRDHHDTSPLVTAALGRLLMAGQMMGVMSKNDDELITLTVRGDGPIGGLTVTADNHGRAKGFAYNPHVWLPLKPDGHLDVGAGNGAGELSVVFDQPGCAPYSSQVELVSGEIGEDLTNYFVLSDQVPTSVGVGVLVGSDLNVVQAGGFIVQLMPGCTDYIADELETTLEGIESVTGLLASGMGPEGMLDLILGDLGYEELEVVPACFFCGCDEARASRAVAALGREELADMIEKGETAEVYCHFCGKKHYLTPDELRALMG